MDVAGELRVTNYADPASGVGLEIGYDTVNNRSFLTSYDRTGLAYKDLWINSLNTVFNAGNVGIGTTSPTHALNVVGDANITGDLFVQGQNMTVPDYVFESYYGDGSSKEGGALSDYNLMPLEELNKYIKQNKQLPPSIVQGQFALEGQSNNLVQQQYYLLEKAEEQTLYILELQKQIDELNKRIELLEKQ